MILFLDDEPHFCQAYIEVMEDAGFVVDIVTTTDEFLRAVSPVTQAVVIDVMLAEGVDAGMVAFEAMRRQLARLPAILLTNRADLDLGPLDDRAIVVSKRDILPTELLELLNRVMSGGRTDCGNQ